MASIVASQEARLEFCCRAVPRRESQAPKTPQSQYLKQLEEELRRVPSPKGTVASPVASGPSSKRRKLASVSPHATSETLQKPSKAPQEALETLQKALELRSLQDCLQLEEVLSAEQPSQENAQQTLFKVTYMHFSKNSATVARGLLLRRATQHGFVDLP